MHQVQLTLIQPMENEFFSNALVTAGWLQPLTLANRHRAMQTIIVHDVLTKRKEPLDQFVKGLETLGVHQLIKSSPGLMKEHLVRCSFRYTCSITLL